MAPRHPPKWHASVYDTLRLFNRPMTPFEIAAHARVPGITKGNASSRMALLILEKTVERLPDGKYQLAKDAPK